jgi:hypothetical protein
LVPAKETLHQGLTVVSSDAETGLAATFVKGERVVYLQARRGAKTDPAMQQNYQGVPEYEVDARFLDEKGLPIMSRVGGHEVMDPTWEASDPKDVKIDVAERQNAIRLTWEAVAALKAAKLPVSVLNNEAHALAQLAATVTESNLTPTKDIAKEGEAKYADTYNHKVYIHYQCITGGCLVGNHSAVWALSFRNSDNAFLWQKIWCNHGACADDPSMGKSDHTGGTASGCPKIWNARANLQPPQQECTTPYSWASTTNTHNCNDDSELQYWNVANNASYGTGAGGYGSCWTNGLHNYKPTCD